MAIPDSEPRPGDVITPLPEGSPPPSDDPRDLEGIWIAVGSPVMIAGAPPYLPAVKADLARRREQEERGVALVRRETLCRPIGYVGLTSNQFPAQILQRPGKILIMAEEHRGIWPVYMDVEHPRNLKPSYAGHNVGHWEGNTLVIDSVGFNGKAGTGWSATHSTELHVITRITRASTDDRLNGARLVIEQTIEDPKVYERPWTSISVARWRPDVQMLEFNCEESPMELTSDGLVVE